MPSLLAEQYRRRPSTVVERVLSALESWPAESGVEELSE
jgi:hypothetical protein